MQFRNTLIVLVLLVIVGGYILLFQFAKPEDATKKLFNVKADDITSVTLKYPGQEIEVRRTDGVWKMVKPLQTDADKSAIGTLTREIADADIKRVVDEHPANLAPFGLDKPAVTLVVGTKDKTFPGVEVGKNAPIGYSVYVKTTDKPGVMLTSGGFGPGTKRTVSDLRDHTLMSFNADDVSKLVIRQGGSAPVELHKEQGKWEIVKPAKYQADSDRVHTMLASLANARIDDFTTDNPSNVAQYGLANPALEVSVYTGPGQSQQSLLFGKKAGSKDDYYVRRGEKPNVYTVHNYVYNDADKSLNDLRDRTVLAFDPAKVEQVKVTNAGKTFALEQHGGKWSEVDGARSDADPAKVRQFIDRMHDLKADSIVQDSTEHLEKFGLNSPNEEVTLLGKDAKPLGTVKLARIERHNENDKNGPARTDYYAMSSASPTVYKLFEYDYSDLVKTPDQFAAPKPAAAPSAKPPAAK
jgi:hypothetical protein